MKQIKIGNYTIDESSKPYIIAEISGNHNGSLDKALRLIEIAKECGADAVKLQTYTADTLTINCDKADFQISEGLWEGKTLYELYEWAHTPWDWHKALFKKAAEVGIEIFSTPFDESSVDFLEDLGVPCYKIASFEATDLPLIEYTASKMKPMIVSTGMANREEIELLVKSIQKFHNDFILLHCVSGYPTPHNQANLKTINKLRGDFNCLIGLSDHTLGIATSITSIALGARVIEKHFTESRSEHGPDSAFSLEPNELKSLCEESRNAWDSLGSASYVRKSVEDSSLKFRRSLYFVQDIKKGQVITPENLRRIRPGFGISPKYYEQILGKTVNIDISKGTAVSFDLIDMKEQKTI